MTPARAGLLILACLAALVLSCDELERHKTLTFFFDGVPPLQGEELEQGLFDPNSAELEPAEQRPAWYVHEPVKDCSNCHRTQRPGGFTRQTHLIAPVPQLCWKCHTDPTASASFVHGPVAVGQCLFCHNQHKSKVEHLLIQAQPNLCYLCHDRSMIELIPAHLTEPTSACTDCHYPHAGPTKALLKGSPSPTERERGSGKPTGAAAQDDIGLVKVPDVEKLPAPETEDKTSQERKNLFEVFWEVSRLIEQGELQKAKEQLEAIRDSELLTKEEREKIENVLRLIDEASANQAREPQNSQGTAGPDKSDDAAAKRTQEVADLYYRSMAYYRDGQLVRAREGFVKVLSSGLIPAAMEKTIRGYIADIDETLARDNRGR